MVSYSRGFNYTDVVLPVECSLNVVLGIYCLVLFVITFYLNCLVCWLYVNCKLYKKPLHVLNLSLIITNILGSVIGLPMIFIRAFACRFLFGKFGCWFQAFGMFFLGSMSIYLFMSISIERYLMTFKPKSALTLKLSFILLGVSLVLSFAWSVAPLLGWSSYVAEGILISCGVQWYNLDASVLSFNIVMLLFLYLVPVCVMLSTSYLFIKELFKINNKVGPQISSERETRRFYKNFRITKLIMITIILFFASWTPYAACAAYQLITNDNAISPTTQTLLALIAKTFLLWHAIIQIKGNKSIQDRIPWKKSLPPVNPTYQSKDETD